MYLSVMAERPLRIRGGYFMASSPSACLSFWMTRRRRCASSRPFTEAFREHVGGADIWAGGGLRRCLRQLNTRRPGPEVRDDVLAEEAEGVEHLLVLRRPDRAQQNHFLDAERFVELEKADAVRGRADAEFCALLADLLRRGLARMRPAGEALVPRVIALVIGRHGRGIIVGVNGAGSDRDMYFWGEYIWPTGTASGRGNSQFPSNSCPSFWCLRGPARNAHLALWPGKNTFKELNSTYPRDTDLANFIRSGIGSSVQRPEITGNDMRDLTYFIRRSTQAGSWPTR